MNVIDVNDNAPMFDPSTYSLEIREDAVKGASVIQVAATDLDSGNGFK